jgi:hypothetical protein
VGAAVVRGCDGAEALLAGRVPLVLSVVVVVYRERYAQSAASPSCRRARWS